MKTRTSTATSFLLAATLGFVTSRSLGQAPPAPPDLLQQIQRQTAEAQRQAVEAGAQVDAARTRALALGDMPILLNLSSGGGRSSGGTIIVPKEAMPAKAVSETEEDLNVMARILEKAIGHDENRAMGIVIRDSILGGSSNLRNLYIEGYGALFFLNVNFPLIAPPAENPEPARTAETNSEWEQTRRELYYPPGAPIAFWDQLFRERLNVKISGGEPPPSYDASKVEELKRSLMDALKNASHIRGLKPDEVIIVVVSGRGASGNASDGSRRVNPSTVSDRNTRMVIRARKSDVDAFQKGDLDAQGFEKKVSVAVY